MPLLSLLETGNSTVTPVVSNLRSTLIRIDPALRIQGIQGVYQIPTSSFLRSSYLLDR